ncbi:ABC transporter substrate-binding protein [Paenibacillus phoenicis]|uniref:ABC transporter substrate-binding protein n=1 Tax=Paenibacillus phoenicis TaxID=554117 RepID=A0ABU5PQ04_9BACL|nr:MULTISPECIES: ABC transporter substrate-binding protein [Paenibacillus]MCT2196118.1 ABC transporter substrate-binding protein [Paenibacillus sp. p3-SID1389]MEA3572040.1 ABC transporter substrate-binding protein [Paenibacillus phoenicis]
MKRFITSILMVILVLALAACSSNTNTAGESNTKANNSNASTATETSAESTEAAKPTTVEFTDSHGTVTVPVNPKSVVALDNRTFETLADWGVKLAAAPKGVMPKDSPYVADESVQDIGNHREPNLEVIAAVNPDLVIVGQRFSGYYEDIKKLVPNAAVIDVNVDVSGENGTPGDNLVNGFKEITTKFGEIFDKNEEAAQLVAEFDQALADAKAAYNGTDKVMSVIVSGGNIGFAAPSTGRVWGPLYDIFGWVPALEVENATTDHQGDEVSVEAIAQSNPDWMFVLDRDAATSSGEESVPAQDVINNAPALQNTTAVSKGQVLYAPTDTYTNESIQTFIEIFQEIAQTLKK